MILKTGYHAFLSKMDTRIAEMDPATVAEKVKGWPPRFKAIIIKLSETGSFNIEKDLKLTAEEWYKTNNRIQNVLQSIGFKVDYSHSSSFYNERVTVTVDKEFLKDFLLYEKISLTSTHLPSTINI